MGIRHMIKSCCWILFWVSLAAAASLDSTASARADKSALLSFLHSWNSTFQAQSPLLSSWNPADDTACRWKGVLCDEQQRVVELSLGGFGLYAQIPSSLGSLDRLRVLNLSLTNLTGTIPSSLGALTALESLDLSDNALTGGIPPALGNLRRLQLLSLNANWLTGPIPPSLGNCSSLQELHLFDNDLNGTLPPELGKLASLEVLRAGGNMNLGGSIPSEFLTGCKNLTMLGLAVTNITGPIPPEIGGLQQLQTLSIYQADLSGEIPAEIGSCASLSKLFLYHNRLTGTIPATIGDLSNLESLMLWQNQLTGPIPASIGRCSLLSVVDLSNNQLSGSIPAELGSLSQLVNFYVSSNNLTGSIPEEIGNCSKLTQLELDTNRLSGSLPASLGRLTSLQRVFCWENELTGELPASLGNCTSLQWLDLSVNKLSGRIPWELLSLPLLQKLLLLNNRLSGSLPLPPLSPPPPSPSPLSRLRLSLNQLSGPLPSGIACFRNLSFLDLSNNFFHGPLPPELVELENLQMLDLRSNRLSGTLPPSLGQLRLLQELHLSSNSLTGSIPSELGRMTSLTRLNLSGNLFKGDIPPELANGARNLYDIDLSENGLDGPLEPSLGSLVSLNNLELQGNQLRGRIPGTFGDLTHLNRLDLSRNQLEGTLQVLKTMSSLSFLNVSYNRFTGTVPDTDVLRKMGQDSFAGNDGLHRDGATGDVRQGRSHSPALRPSIVVGVLFAGTTIIVVLGSVLLYKRCQRLATDTWKMELYHKWNASAYDVVKSLERGQVIGHGSSGKVYQVKMPGGELIAIKKVDFGGGGSGGGGIDSEICTLTQIRHKNIVRLIGYCSNRETGLLLYDFKTNGSLGELLHDKRRPIDWELRYKIALGAAQGLAYLHHDCSPPILHRDIKANNILLGAGMEPYIADFGLAKVMRDDEDSTSEFVVSWRVAGTTGYIAPEYSSQVKITTKSDVYSYGVVLLEILTGRRALEHDTSLVDWVRRSSGGQPNVEALDPRLRGMADPFIHEMLQALGIALECLHQSPHRRPSMKDVVALLKNIKHELHDDILAHKKQLNQGRPSSSYSSFAVAGSSTPADAAAAAAATSQ